MISDDSALTKYQGTYIEPDKHETVGWSCSFRIALGHVAIFSKTLVACTYKHTGDDLLL